MWNTNLRIAATPTLAGCALLLLGGCAGGNSRDAARHAPSAAAGSGYETVSGALELRKNERGSLLRIAGTGRFSARCDASGRPHLVFNADRLLPTAAVALTSEKTTSRTVVQPRGKVVAPVTNDGADFQIWQVSPFSKANDEVTTAWISLGVSAGRPYYMCGFSAHALAPTTGS